MSAVRAVRHRFVGFATGVRHGYERGARGVEASIKLVERRYTPLGRFTPGPFEGWRFLWRPAIVGFVALSAVLAGASFSNSPFKLNMVGTWFFGEPSGSGRPVLLSDPTVLFSIALVIGGLVLLMRVWLRLAEVVKYHPKAPVVALWGMFLLWSIPMIIAPPLFSRDVYSYAAQGEMTSHTVSPYLNGPGTLGSGPFVAPVDSLWLNTPAPYGPFFLFLDGSIAKLTGHHELATVVGLRLLEVAAVVLLGFALTSLARTRGRDPGEVLVLGIMNPVVLLSLIGGAHNDAAMAALLVAGVAMAARKRPVVALFLCAAAAAIKAPAALGILYVAWTWLGPNLRLREKWRPFAMATVISATTLGVFSWLAGFGLGWIRNLATPGTVVSWTAPATGVGMALSGLLHLIGIPVSTSIMINVTRILGFLGAVVYAGWLLINADRRGWIRSLALSLLLFVVLGPVIWPWYLVWGLALMAVSYVGREHFWLLLLSIISPFRCVTSFGPIGSALRHSGLGPIVLALALLALLILYPLGGWTQWSRNPEPELQAVAASY